MRLALLVGDCLRQQTGLTWGLWLSLALVFGCDRPETPQGLDEVVINAPRGGTHSSTAGNLMAEAIRRVHDLDVVLYPRPLIDHRRSDILKREMQPYEIESLLKLYPLEGDDDQFIVGAIQGKDLKKLVFQRSQLNYDLELEVAGLWYNIHFVGGFPHLQTYARERHVPLNDHDSYRVAVSQSFFLVVGPFRVISGEIALILSLMSWWSASQLEML